MSTLNEIDDIYTSLSEHDRKVLLDIAHRLARKDAND